MSNLFASLARETHRSAVPSPGRCNSLSVLVGCSICIFLLAFLAPRVFASTKSIVVLGLFPNMVVIRVDGRQDVLHVGESTPGGVKLISANSQAAVLEVDGKRERVTLANRVSTQFKSPKQATARIWPDAQGMYMTSGAINGYPVNFMVDTGSTWVTMNEPQARRLGINFRYQGSPAMISTANGHVRVYKLTLDSVTVGGITLHNVTAAVEVGNSPSVTLLGMSFLSQVDMRHKGQMLELQTKW